ncbi:hypothetical protein, partial [Streptomyces sp. NPDC002769]|uniref:hypothetical protein n=1 Tax=Streptomyces sp. NPDC002769 TaxID=3154542 RepID=UPI003333C1EF
MKNLARIAVTTAAVASAVLTTGGVSSAAQSIGRPQSADTTVSSAIGWPAAAVTYADDTNIGWPKTVT